MSTIENFWDPEAYSQFLDARTKPAHDLLSAISETVTPNLIYDLGCGPGNSTILLKSRWPRAKIIGVDSSENMLKLARSKYPQIEFIMADITHFSTPEKSDLIFANASLQWVDNHESLIPKLVSQLNHQGILAIQMPNNFHSPSHQIIIKILQNNPAWQGLLKNLCYGAMTKPRYQLPWYYDLLTKIGVRSLQLWETKYFQEMLSYQDIFDWVKGTALQPVLSIMNAKNQIQFAKSYIQAISKEYPLQKNHKVLLPFRRIFMVGSI